MASHTGSNEGATRAWEPSWKISLRGNSFALIDLFGGDPDIGTVCQPVISGIFQSDCPSCDTYYSIAILEPHRRTAGPSAMLVKESVSG